MYNHNKAQQSKNRVYISWDILYYSTKHDTCRSSTSKLKMETAMGVGTIRAELHNNVSAVEHKVDSLGTAVHTNWTRRYPGGGARINLKSI